MVSEVRLQPGGPRRERLRHQLGRPGWCDSLRGEGMCQCAPGESPFYLRQPGREGALKGRGLGNFSQTESWCTWFGELAYFGEA